ncbi:FABP family protein [Sesbania bispinosa]|nr:FABP family protein [Sesbania bispinosa]
MEGCGSAAPSTGFECTGTVAGLRQKTLLTDSIGMGPLKKRLRGEGSSVWVPRKSALRFSEKIKFEGDSETFLSYILLLSETRE